MSGGGSKPGERRGGRQKGTPNKRTLELLALARENGGGITPKEVMLCAMRYYWAEGQIAEAVECAAKAAPYEHPRLTSLDARLDARVSLAVDDAGERLAYELNRPCCRQKWCSRPSVA